MRRLRRVLLTENVTLATGRDYGRGPTVRPLLEGRRRRQPAVEDDEDDDRPRADDGSPIEVEDDDQEEDEEDEDPDDELEAEDRRQAGRAARGEMDLAEYLMPGLTEPTPRRKKGRRRVKESAGRGGVPAGNAVFDWLLD